MKIEKINGFWVPSNDIHIEQWRQGQPFTQKNCLDKFLKYCNSQNKKFKTVLDIGAWCGTWSKAMEKYCNNIIAFEPDKVNFECLMKNCTINFYYLKHEILILNAIFNFFNNSKNHIFKLYYFILKK